MRKTLFSLFVLVMFLHYSCENGNEKSNIRILKVAPETIKAQPDKGFEITYRWEATSDINIEDDSVLVSFINENGEKVLSDNHIIPDVMEEDGTVAYKRTVTLPVWEIKDDQTYNAVLPEGRYTILAGVYDRNKDQMKNLKKGTGVKPESDTLFYEIGTLELDYGAPVPDPGEVTLDLGDYHLTFDEEFDELSVSAWGPVGEGGTTWIAHTPWNGDFGDAEFVDPQEGFPFTIEDGILRIEVKKVNGEWQSGLLSASDPEGNGFSQKYGYFECRAKFPKGPGTWPAFWLMGKKNLEPATDPTINPEVDVVEHYGHWPNRFSYVLHLWGRGGAESLHEGKRIKVFGVEEDFHTYGVMIDEDYITLYFDGVEMDRMETPDGVKVPLYPIVNLALGPGWPTDKTPDPSYMYVDYIKVYSK